MSGPLAIQDQVVRALEPAGMFIRGLVQFAQGEGPILSDGTHACSVLLLGNIGGSIWPAFEAWRRTYDGPDPLDTWSKSEIQPLAAALGATAYFPSDPPFQPFQQWAVKAEGLRASPLGILIHPTYGLWHGYRGALGFGCEIPQSAEVSLYACSACADKPCLSACPVGAVSLERFDVPACRVFLNTGAGNETCQKSGCLARNVCPAGSGFRYPRAQLRFHMSMLEL